MLWHEYDFTPQVTFGKKFMSPRDIFERQCLHDHGADLPGFDEAQGVDQFGCRSKVRSKIILLFVPQKSDIERGLESGSRAAGHNGAAPFQAVRAGFPSGCSRVLEDDIDALAFRDLHDLAGYTLGTPVNGVVRSQLFGEAAFFPTARDRDRAYAKCFA